MGRKRGNEGISYTLPPSPSHSSSSSSSSSSDFEFSISISPRKSSTLLCPADELFYKGQLLPLHHSPRISMVRTLLLSSSAPRDSTASTSSSSNDSSFASDLALFPDFDDSSDRPSNATQDDDFFNRHHHNNNNNAFNLNKPPTNTNHHNNAFNVNKPPTNTKSFSFSRLSSVFRPKTRHPESLSESSVRRISNTAREVIRKYLNKVKPFYDRLSHKQQQQPKTERSAKETEVSGKGGATASKETESAAVISHSFSGNLRYPLRRRRSCVSSCPSSMRSSPSHSGVLSRGGFAGAGGRVAGGTCYGDASTMEELQSAIQGAIAHCKNSLIQNKTMRQFIPGSD